MPRTLYSPRLSDDVVRLLYKEGQRRGEPMTRVADDLLRQAFSRITGEGPDPRLGENEPLRFPRTDAA